MDFSFLRNSENLIFFSILLLLVVIVFGVIFFVVFRVIKAAAKSARKLFNIEEETKINTREDSATYQLRESIVPKRNIITPGQMMSGPGFVPAKRKKKPSAVDIKKATEIKEKEKIKESLERFKKSNAPEKEAPLSSKMPSREGSAPKRWRGV